MADTDKTSQAQSGSSDKDRRDKTAKDSDEIQFFDTSITKLVDRPVLDDKGEETGKTETVEVLSDNLYPGERLKREVDEERVEQIRQATRKDREQADKKTK